MSSLVVSFVGQTYGGDKHTEGHTHGRTHTRRRYPQWGLHAEGIHTEEMHMTWRGQTHGGTCTRKDIHMEGIHTEGIHTEGHTHEGDTHIHTERMQIHTKKPKSQFSKGMTYPQDGSPAIFSGVEENKRADQAVKEAAIGERDYKR